MATALRPLLLFPAPAPAVRAPATVRDKPIHFPGIGRQAARVTPQLNALRQAFDAKRLRVQQEAPFENPELILVLEIAGQIRNFAKAVRRLPGLEWLHEWAVDQFDPDDDFYIESKNEEHKPYSGRLFLLGSNQAALMQLLSLWDRYQQNPSAPFAIGLAPFKHLFAHLRTIRQWDDSDRIDADVRQYWQHEVESGSDTVRFEIEAWYFASEQRNQESRAEVEAVVAASAGHVVDRVLIAEISYHGFLVELPTHAIVSILAGERPGLVLSDRIMFFRPQTQSIFDGNGESQAEFLAEVAAGSEGPPVVALLDGLPLANHALLAGRLEVDDPDGWAATYEAKDRVHGTAMASLILHGELEATLEPLVRRIYVRPILRPDPTDFNQRRSERTPNDQLLIDLIHRAVKRICVGEMGNTAVAPTVRVINLSIGDVSRVFVRELSPFARLLDWLSYEYSVLFIVSAGNDSRNLQLNIPSDTLSGVPTEARATLAFNALVTSDSIDRRLISPAEAMNVLTVGALHDDLSNAPAVSGRYDLFQIGGLSPLSRVGHGYRRSVKPDLLMPGGRVLYREIPRPGQPVTELEVVTGTRAPGHLAAYPPLPGEGTAETAHCRGTSNAAAMASRAASQAYDVLEELRTQIEAFPGPSFDAVLLKALLVHGAHWGDWRAKLLAERPEFQQIANGSIRRSTEMEFVTRWLGYGLVNFDSAINCTAQRATLIGAGELGANEAFLFSAPLPPGLAGKRVWRRLTLTLAWMSPINTAHQGYRRAKVWVDPPHDDLQVERVDADWLAVRRGTVQHEVLEGDRAVAFADGDHFSCKVTCAADAGELNEKVTFALCVSLEVAIDSEIAIYDEIRERIAPPIGIQPG